MSDDNGQLPVKVSVEVSKETSDKLASVLTDILSPLSQGLGAIGDWIGEVRLRNTIKAARRARELIAEHSIEPNSLPLKFLVPWIELTSLEDDDTLVETWAQLLAAAASDYQDEHRRFSTILAALGPEEVRLLKTLYDIASARSSDDDLNKFLGVLSQQVREEFRLLLGKLDEGEATLSKDRFDSFVEKVRDHLSPLGAHLLRAKANKGDNTEFTTSNEQSPTEEKALSSLEGQRLVEFDGYTYEAATWGGGLAELGIVKWAMITPLGLRFVEACSGLTLRKKS